jgi:hypothetical protein
MAKKKDQPKTDGEHDAQPDTHDTPPVATPDTAGAASGSQPINKSESIRKVFEEMGMDTPAEKVRTILAERGVEVSSAAIYQTRARMGGGGKRVRGESKQGRVDDDYEELLTVKEFANDVGGLERLKRLCDVLLRLQQD